jgi:hypothetical protein
VQVIRETRGRRGGALPRVHPGERAFDSWTVTLWLCCPYKHIDPKNRHIDCFRQAIRLAFCIFSPHRNDLWGLLIWQTRPSRTNVANDIGRPNRELICAHSDGMIAS